MEQDVRQPWRLLWVCTVNAGSTYEVDIYIINAITSIPTTIDPNIKLKTYLSSSKSGFMIPPIVLFKSQS